MRPREVIQKWVEAFNNADSSRLAEMDSETAVNYQVPEKPVEGKEAIRKMFEEDFTRAEIVCIVENTFEDGEWAILEWKDPLGLRGCGFSMLQMAKSFSREVTGINYHF